MLFTNSTEAILNDLKRPTHLYASDLVEDSKMLARMLYNYVFGVEAWIRENGLDEEDLASALTDIFCMAKDLETILDKALTNKAVEW